MIGDPRAAGAAGGSERRSRRGWCIPLVASGLFVAVGCGGAEPEAQAPAVDDGGVPASVQESDLPPFGFAGPVLSDLPPEEEVEPLLHETERDWAIAQGTVEWAHAQGLGGLPIGEVAAILGTTFVGTPYEPGTLELPGPEALVVNLRAFDCVTFVEHLLVLARLAVGQDERLLADPEAFRDRYRRELTTVRYREGRLDGYPSRLHYFSDWLRDAEAKGLVRDVTHDLGGVEDTRPIHFMSSNPESYRQLQEDPANLDAVRRIETALNEYPRFYVPQDRIAEVEAGIESGDIIATVSTIDGLDVAHTGIALRHGGRIHLMHAPLVGDSVEISARPLAERIQGISGQQGIIVARMMPPAGD